MIWFRPWVTEIARRPGSLRVHAFRRLSPVLLCASAACTAQSADVVARAGQLTLPSDTLVAMIAASPAAPLRREAVEWMAHRWVEYALLVQRMATGDSLLDTATVADAYWADANQWLVDAYHDSLVAQRIHDDSAAVDSAYAADQGRLIYHILIRTAPDMSPPERARARQKAGRIHAALVAGGAWATANEANNDDPTARRNGGSLGFVRRGDMVEPFEQAAFGLQPGELSDVVETRFGYHLIRRPTLAEAYDEFRDAVREAMVARMDSVFLADLETRSSLSVGKDAPARMREAAQAPLASLESDDVLATYRGGRFTVADFIRWLQALPPPVAGNVVSATDEQLTEFGRSLARNEVLVREAREHGMTLSDADWTELRDRLRGELDLLRTQLKLDSAFAGAESAREKTEAGDRAVLTYLSHYVKNPRAAVVVPTFLAYRLRNDADWRVSGPALDDVVARATAQRAQAVAAPSAPSLAPDSTRAGARAADSLAAPGPDGAETP
jgi:hypothetical protein